VVQKFGGTLLRSPVERARVVEQIRQSRTLGRRIIVVASAMGRASEPYATDTLLRMASDIDPHVDPRTQDLLISCGEIISTALLAHVLAQAGFRSLALTGAEAGIVTDDQFGAANITSIQPLRVLRALRDGLIPVIAGFQGRTAGGDMTTLGRGGSDITAVALAAAVGGDVEIFKDFEGVMTADPRIVPAARTIPRMTYADASQAGWLGARVCIHERQSSPASIRFVYQCVRCSAARRVAPSSSQTMPRVGDPSSSCTRPNWTAGGSQLWDPDFATELTARDWHARRCRKRAFPC
jgi:aspartate kinase